MAYTSLLMECRLFWRHFLSSVLPLIGTLKAHLALLMESSASIIAYAAVFIAYTALLIAYTTLLMVHTALWMVCKAFSMVHMAFILRIRLFWWCIGAIHLSKQSCMYTCEFCMMRWPLLGVLLRVAACCTVLQRVAECCSVSCGCWLTYSPKMKQHRKC